MEYALQFQKLCQVETRRLLFVMGIVAIIVLVSQSLTLQLANVHLSLFLDHDVPILGRNNFLTGYSSPKSPMVGNFPLFNASDMTDTSVFLGVVKNTDPFNMGEIIEHDIETKGNDRDPENGFALNKDRGPGNAFELDGNAFELGKDRNPDDESSSERVVDLDTNSKLENVKNTEHGSPLENTKPEDGSFEHINKPDNAFSTDTVREARTTMTLEKVGIAVGKQLTETLAKGENPGLLQSRHATSGNISAMNSNPTRKKMRSQMPPLSIMSISEMNLLLLRSRASSRSMRPRWSSVRDQEILSAKSRILNAPIVKNDQELYASLFRNVSMFKRSYELMERMLKVYVYKEGKRPIFHQPVLKGIYASEGWFMKLMEGNKRFVVKDPKKAHLFYMPFSSRMLEYTVYVPNSHNRTNLAKYLKNYADMIAAKYPFWNRTGGADHFLVACHDWAPYETRHHMERCIKALCNADVTMGYKIGRDVSLPETYVRSAKNPLRDVGGKPPSERPILAFFAGSMHGYLRPILLQYWENKDPDMKIFGPMPRGVASKMNYIQHMKTSKYCICAKGYEVNSPRVVEAIFYECVPVIISDNFVPPFFDVLDWYSFSVFVPEKDISNLKNILLSIPEEKYLAMQLRVKKVQRHFLWHSKPMKYDMFHMILHAIWYNRVLQIKPR
ncbi:hypothetical protein HHK36_014169 [Tetracentron sinense]|uniref:Exostosin GT47 domain-containing protein n=1 Tax=Tetracentron sinense TaxID=13715 RepID=A0A834ZBR3_TETSI|nr:hypothetical protein HHK36_014169 [Tetracentron sinense]